MLHFDIYARTLHFRQPAGTSRGTYTTRKSWYVVATDTENPHAVGVGECAPLPDLSTDAIPNYEQKLTELCRLTEQNGAIDHTLFLGYPSMRFGIETALLHLNNGIGSLFNVSASAPIPINGLIWMGTYSEMAERIEEKVAKGYRCIKLKIGAIDFEKELDLLHRIRNRFDRNTVELRVDANGAFSPADAPKKLEALAKLDLHSIEQPIKARQWIDMARLCRTSPLPIALDEELIGVETEHEKATLLDAIRPQYIILKPSLHGGIYGCQEWIRLAEERNIQWWITSALESNIGLNAIAQWTATLGTSMPQGLGTGMLFTDNIDMPLTISGDMLYIDNNNFPNNNTILSWIKS